MAMTDVAKRWEFIGCCVAFVREWNKRFGRTAVRFHGLDYVTSCFVRKIERDGFLFNIEC